MPDGGDNNNNNNNNNTTTDTSNNSEITLSNLLAQCITELADKENSNTNTDTASDPNCEDTAPVGDGWGWNGIASCRVGASATTTSANQCSTTEGNNSGSQGGQYGTGFTDYTNAQPTCQEASDRILRLVTKGMHESEVLKMVGKPKHVRTSGSSYLYWGYSDKYNSATTAPYITFNSNARTVYSFSVDSTNCR